MNPSPNWNEYLYTKWSKPNFIIEFLDIFRKYIIAHFGAGFLQCRIYFKFRAAIIINLIYLLCSINMNMLVSTPFKHSNWLSFSFEVCGFLCVCFTGLVTDHYDHYRRWAHPIYNINGQLQGFSSLYFSLSNFLYETSFAGVLATVC